MTRWRASDRALHLSLAVGILLAPVAAEAQERPRVLFVLQPEHPQREQLAMAVQAQLQDLAVELTLVDEVMSGGPDARLRRAAALQRQHRAVAVLWLDHGLGTRLFCFAPGSGQVQAREISGTGVAAVEQTALITRSLVASIQDAPRAVAARSLDDAAAMSPSPQRGRQGLSVRLGYQGWGVSERIPWHGGLGAGARWWPSSALYLGADLCVCPPLRVSAAELIQLRALPLRLVTGYAWRLGPLRAGLEGGALIEPSLRETLRTAPATVPTAARPGLSLGGSLAVRAGLRPTPAVELFVDCGAEILIFRTLYAAAERAGIFEEPWWVRPRLGLGLEVHL